MLRTRTIYNGVDPTNYHVGPTNNIKSKNIEKSRITFWLNININKYKYIE